VGRPAHHSPRPGPGAIEPTIKPSVAAAGDIGLPAVHLPGGAAGPLRPGCWWGQRGSALLNINTGAKSSCLPRIRDGSRAALTVSRGAAGSPQSLRTSRTAALSPAWGSWRRLTRTGAWPDARVWRPAAASDRLTAAISPIARVPARAGNRP